MAGTRLLTTLARHGAAGAIPRAAHSTSERIRKLAQELGVYAHGVVEQLGAAAHDGDLSPDGRARRIGAATATAEADLAKLRELVDGEDTERAVGAAWERFGTPAQAQADALDPQLAVVVAAHLRDLDDDGRSAMLEAARADGDELTLHALALLPVAFGGTRELRETAKNALWEVLEPEKAQAYHRERAALDELREAVSTLQNDLSGIAAGRADIDSDAGAAGIAAARRRDAARSELGVEPEPGNDDQNEPTTPAARLAAARRTKKQTTATE